LVIVKMQLLSITVVAVLATTAYCSIQEQTVTQLARELGVDKLDELPDGAKRTSEQTIVALIAEIRKSQPGLAESLQDLKTAEDAATGDKSYQDAIAAYYKEAGNLAEELASNPNENVTETTQLKSLNKAVTAWQAEQAKLVARKGDIGGRAGELSDALDYVQGMLETVRYGVDNKKKISVFVASQIKTLVNSLEARFTLLGRFWTAIDETSKYLTAEQPKWAADEAKKGELAAVRKRITREIRKINIKNQLYDETDADKEDRLREEKEAAEAEAERKRLEDLEKKRKEDEEKAKRAEGNGGGTE